MHLENVVHDATDPQALGRFWETALGTEQLTDELAGYETRLAVPDGPVLDLCFQRVPEPPTGPQRLLLELSGDEEGRDVERLLALGARRVGESDGPAVLLADPGGNPFRLVASRTAYVDQGPVAALSLAVADPGRELDFWSWLTSWAPADAATVPALRHPSGRGPLLVLRPEDEPKGDGKNRIHLDVRLEAGEDADEVGRAIADRGGRELRTDWGDLPWRSYLDPSGNEFCVLPAPR